MTKDVLITISGLQTPETGEEEPLEMITSGSYYYKNGKHYLLFDEVQEGFEGKITSNRIKITDEALDVRKKGISNAHMVFEKDKKNLSYYETPFGNLLVGIHARNIELQEEENNIDLDVKYDLEINSRYIAECMVHLNVTDRKEGNFSL